MSIVFITDSPVWSLGKGKGAPSFYNTLKRYNDSEKVILLTTEKNLDLDELESVDIVTMPKLPLIKSTVLFGSLRLLHKYINYFISQFIGLFFLLKMKDCQMVYGYEIGFIPAMRWFSIFKKTPILSRFQGTVLTDLVQNVGRKRKAYLILKFLDHIWALKIKPKLTIMTDDGTKGDEVLHFLRGKSSDILFIRNGVDLANIADVQLNKYPVNHASGDVIFSSVSRLQGWKRLDRSIAIFAEFHKSEPNSHYYICGDGTALNELTLLVEKLCLTDAITFLGAVDKGTIYNILLDSHYFLSTYELSNLGNPLFEAIRCRCLAVTIDNGDTASIIKDGVTGIISSEESFQLNSRKILNYLDKKQEVEDIINKANDLLDKKLVTWEERMEVEYSYVSCLYD